MAADTITLNDPTPVLGASGAATGTLPGKHARTAKNVGWYVLLSLLSLVVLFPVWMTLVRALSTPVAYVNEGLPLYPVSVEWDIFSRAFSEGELGRRMWLSAIVTFIIAAAQLITSILCAYAFAFLRFPFKRLVFVVFMATLMLPIEVTLIPNVTTIRNLGWLNSYEGLTVPFLATAFGIFLIRQGFMGIPKDLLDAAKLDGYGHFAFMTRVAVPVTRPVVASFGVIALLAAWNQYLWPRAVVTVSEWETVQIGLKSVAASNVEESNIGFAAAIIAALPVLLLLIFLQRQLIRGLTAGAVKG
ncbi:MAG: carbohydrate ABC transporter permease [Acidimicrobiales bacterium]|nr:carbohydrate ABC transporter permease [Acidimicrobiales bacterium]MCB1015681.1 carbohydrate ABC transporter permease [Acidimicrobiales bacterium]MCB9373494.1 carbohydrate ABC transporter permease [Microthrixaceae bacterium]